MDNEPLFRCLRNHSNCKDEIRYALDTENQELKSLTPCKLLSLSGFLIGSMLMCSCSSYDLICNMSIGSVQSPILHQNNCAYPGLTSLPDGGMLVAYACPGGVIGTQISTDNGLTWVPNTPVPVNGPASLTLLPDGEIFLSTSVTSASGIGTPAFSIGTISKGGALSWSGLSLINVLGWTHGCWAMSPVISLQNGRLLWPVWCYSSSLSGWPGSSLVLISDDGGSSWGQQVVVGNGSADKMDYDEAALAAYPNGDVVMIMRQSNNFDADEYGSWWRSLSKDDGNSWSVPVEVADTGVVGHPAITILNSGALVLLSRYHVSGTGSTGFATSWDEGQHFSRFRDLGFDASGTGDVYDAMAVRPDGTIGVATVHSNPGGKSTNVDYRTLVNQCPLVNAPAASLLAGAKSCSAFAHPSTSSP